MFTLTTAGVIGVDNMLVGRQKSDRNTITTLIDFVNPEKDAAEAILDLIASAGNNGCAILHLTPPWDKADLTANTLDASPMFRHVKERVQALCNYLSNAAVRYNDQDGYPLEVIGYEYGLAFVPMQDHYREEIRRMAELQAIFARYAHTYRICFPGGHFAYVKQPIKDGFTDSQLLDLEQLYGDKTLGKYDERVERLAREHRKLRDRVRGR